jgi:hypothetical protein
VLRDHFSGRPTGETNIRFIDRAGTTLLDGALAHFVLKLFRTHQATDHALNVSRVGISTAVRKTAAVLCGRYQQLFENGMVGKITAILNRTLNRTLDRRTGKAYRAVSLDRDRLAK